MIKFIHQNGDRYVEVTIRHEDSTVSDVCEEFMNFLRGVGYSIGPFDRFSIESDEECCGTCHEEEDEDEGDGYEIEAKGENTRVVVKEDEELWGP